jgi:hypothetical protein
MRRAFTQFNRARHHYLERVQKRKAHGKLELKLRFTSLSQVYLHIQTVTGLVRLFTANGAPYYKSYTVQDISFLPVLHSVTTF